MSPPPCPAPWDPQFETILRSGLNLVEEHAPLAPDTSLPALGLDSTRTAELLAELEEAYDIVLPDDALSTQTVATPANLWTQIATTRASVAAPQGDTP